MRIGPVSLLVDEIESPIGRIVIAARDDRLCALEFGRARLGRVLAVRYGRTRTVRTRNPFGFSARIRAYLAGDLIALDRIQGQVTRCDAGQIASSGSTGDQAQTLLTIQRQRLSASGTVLLVMRRGADGAWKVSRETGLTPGL